MTHIFEFANWMDRLRAPLLGALVLTLVSCNPTDSLTPTETNIDVVDDGTSAVGEAAPAMSASYAGGIPFGNFNQPTTQFGSYYNGALRNIYPQYLLSNLAGIKSRGGKVVLTFSGKESTFKDANGNFSFSKWKARVDRFRKVNFSSYVKDGTIIGHYLVDEPNDPSNWNGHPISPATVEAMAKYSKQIWPSLPTIVRAYPEYMLKFSGKYYYLDAAWAQYVYRKGDVSTFIRQNVSYAQQKGLALVVGLNYLHGGPNRTKMTATQVRNWGSTLLSSSYPCAFVSYSYNSTYLSNSGIRDAMRYLKSKATGRGFRSCRGP